MYTLQSQVENIPTNWKDLLLQYPRWNDLELLFDIELNKESELNIFPKLENVFKCFHFFNIENTKVIILGQDPYHRQGQATGLAFGVSEMTKKPPSLKNIFKLLPFSKTPQTLECWAKQGVLLMNTYLTVRESKPNSHSHIWKDFTLWILSQNKNKVYILWGAHAHLLATKANVMNDLCFISSHPSPLSVTKKYKSFPSFIESDVFQKVNDYFIENNEDSIKW